MTSRLLLLWRVAFCAVTAANSSGLGAAPASAPVVRPEGPALESTRPLSSNDKERLAVSGIACAAASAVRHCLVAFDEGLNAQFVTLGPDHVEPAGAPIALRPAGGELDAEGVAIDGDAVYVVGSHSVKRKSCESNEASRYVVRMRVAWPVSAASAPRVEPGTLQVSDKLWNLMQRDPYLSQHIDGCLGSGKGGKLEQMKRRPGLNIEGIAAQAGRLYFGFRGPSELGLAPVFSTSAAALFEGSTEPPTLHRLQVGFRVGIRDMAAGAIAILLLLGPDDHDAPATTRWRVASWTPGAAGAPRVLATLDLGSSPVGNCTGAGAGPIKPEAMAILEETPNSYRVAVLSDSACDGGALIFKLTK